ncbi:MAG TPA: cupin domain-containing protein [Chloroflexota bacterium]|nr:cupin domain-containing protein [Chloroflexota bacterium]
MYCSIIVKGHLDQRWSEWFDGLTITNLANGTTALAGHLPDQAALHGMLTKVRDLGLILVSMQCEDSEHARQHPRVWCERARPTAMKGRIMAAVTHRQARSARGRNKEKTMAYVVRLDELPRDGNTYRFEGHQHGDAALSFFLVDVPPGAGPRLHRHPYEEVFVVQEGHATVTVGDDTLQVTGGQIVVVPPGMPHRFVNTGDGPLRQVNIQPAGSMATEWLEETITRPPRGARQDGVTNG